MRQLADLQNFKWASLFLRLYDEHNITVLADTDFFTDEEREFYNNSDAYVVLINLDTGEIEEFATPTDVLKKYDYLLYETNRL